VILLGVFTWSVTMVKSGLFHSWGIGFWGANGHDAIWHLALANQLQKGNFVMPVFGGVPLKNYHIGFDLMLAMVGKITSLSLSNLYFQIFPPILALLIGYLSYVLLKLLNHSKLESVIVMLFVFFGSGFGWLVSAIRGQGFYAESMFWAQSQISTLINPPYALSLVITLAAIILTMKYLREKKLGLFILAAVLFGILIEVKVYAGILAIISLFFAGVFLWIQKKDTILLKLFLLSFLLSVLVFAPFVKNSAGLIVFYPFWFLETMMAASDKLNWPRFYSAMTSYRMGGQLVKAVAAYFLAFGIFLIGNLGLRFLGLFEISGWLKKPHKLSWIKVYLLVTLVLSLIIPMFFLQKGTPWNTIQFFYYFLFFSSFLAGEFLSGIISKLKKAYVQYAVFGVFMFFLIPNTWATLENYLPQRPPSYLSNDEIQALNYLKSLPDGIVLTYPFDVQKSNEAQDNPPRPLYLYVSTAYVSAFSGKVTFLEDQMNLDITNYDWRNRLEQVDSFYGQGDQSKARNFLGDNKIKYVYWLKGQRAFLGEGQLGLTRVFENNSVDIYKVE